MSAACKPHPHVVHIGAEDNAVLDAVPEQPGAVDIHVHPEQSRRVDAQGIKMMHTGGSHGCGTNLVLMMMWMMTMMMMMMMMCMSECEDARAAG